MRLSTCAVACVVPFVLCTLTLGQVPEAPKVDTDNLFIAATLEGFFPGQSRGVVKRLNVYMVRIKGQWAGAIGTPTFQGRAQYNTALMPVDVSRLELTAEGLSGPMVVTLVPDPWVPKDQKTRTVPVTLNARFVAGADPKSLGSVRGEFTATFEGEAEELKAADLHAGEIKGAVSGGLAHAGPPSLRNASYDLALYQLIPGDAKAEFHRRRALSLGIVEGQVVSARLGQMDMRHNAYDYVVLPKPTELTIDSNGGIRGKLSFKSETLDAEEADFTVELSGIRVAGWAAGSFKATIRVEGRPDEIRQSHWRANVRDNAAFQGEATAARDVRPWFAEVEGHQPFKAGEHPRLFFRKADVPELRRRAATPEGQIIVKRLRELLNGGDGQTMPTSFNPATRAYENNKFKPVTGSFTISHAAGFGFLYQLTGEEKYADLARQCLEKGFAGQRSADDRYSWVAPGGELRAGPSIGWAAVAYDLCYDAWPEEYRRSVALKIQNYSDTLGGEWNNPEGITLRGMVLQPKQGPGSNHFGAVCGGSGLAVLAVHLDPGTDSALTGKYIEVLQRQVVRHLSAGWGDGGYYKEGWGASRVGTQGGFLSFLQALKVAVGRDYLNVERTNASYITMVPRVLMVLGPPGYFPYRSNMGPTYGNPSIGSMGERDGMSKGGYFSEGFGALADRYKPGMLWMYENVFNADGKDPFDTASSYPHRAMLALVNWPTFSGVKAANPAEVMPLATRDSLYEYFVFRNRFADKNDVVTTVLINQPDGTKPRGVMVWGMGGLRLELGEPRRGAMVTHYAPERDGSGSLATEGFMLLVDHSGRSGSDVLVVTTATARNAPKADPRLAYQEVELGGTKLAVLTLSAESRHNAPTVKGGELIVGERRIRVAQGKLEAQ